MNAQVGVFALLGLFVAAAHGQNAPPPPDAPAAESPREAPDGQSGVDVADVIAAVAAQTGREFVLDPRLRRIYVGNMAIDEITYPALLSLLRVNGWFAAEVDGRTVLIPSGNARSTPTKLLQRDDPAISDHEYVTRVIRVAGNRSANGEGEPTNAAMLVPVLRPLIPVEGHLAAVGEHLIVVDRYDNVRRITAIVDAVAR